jgi:FkbM family methyltransferase
MSDNVELNERDYAYEIFGQEGEDGLLRRWFENKQEPGFYVDVGAHHPFRFSNTYRFYKQGWSGLNIEANPDALALFERYRPRDLNLQCLVAEEDGVEHEYILFGEGAYNTANPASRDNLASMGIHATHAITLRSRRLDSLLEEHLPSGRDITLLSVDVEGLDLQVLRSNDWTRFRPEVVVTETWLDLLNPMSNAACAFMVEQGYKLRSYLHMSALFQRD